MIQEFGRCQRCYHTWDMVDPHRTWWTLDVAILALCEPCWYVLPVHLRLPYHAVMVARWAEQGLDPEALTVKWPLIAAAVLAGK
jgi:hypothetical protein